MATIHGISRITVNGVEKRVGDSVNIEMGGEVLEPQVGQTGHDYTSSYQPGSVEFELMIEPGESIRSIQQTRDATIVVETRAGKAYTGARMTYVGPANPNPVNGRVSCRYVGDAIQEI